MIREDTFNFIEYYRYLNGGYRLPLVGGTDKMSSEVPVGLYRTYVYIPPDEEFTYESWCRNMAAGRTILSGGPLLDFTVEGVRVGDTLALPAGGGMVVVEANGNQELLSIKIDREVITPDDPQMLEDLVLAAANEALRKARELVASEMSKIAGGVGGKIPGLF